MSRHPSRPVPSPPEPLQAIPAVAGAERDLAVCEACASELVEPVAWESAAAESWRLTLRCPNCQLVTEGVFSQECVDRFDQRLDEATSILVRDLKRLEHANMCEDVDRFIGALHAGAILPEDFAVEVKA